MRELTRAITRNGALLAGFAVLTALLVAGTHLGTRDRISVAQRMAEQKALLEIVPQKDHDNVMLDDWIIAPAGEPLLQLSQDKPIYLARQNGKPSAAVIPVTAPDGYSGAIDLIVGVNRDGSVAGVRVLQHRETPGLGDAIDHRKSDWIESFRGKSLKSTPVERWTVTKDGGDFDQFTGATITPRAVVKATARALAYVEEHRNDIFPAKREPATVTLADESKNASQSHWQNLREEVSE